MKKQEWDQLQVAFLFAHEQMGINAKSWCNKAKLNYSTARRYIKVRTVKENDRLKVNSNPIIKARKVPKRRGAPFGSQNALKHGGYSKYFYNGWGQVVEAITADDELLLCRSRIHHAISKLLLINQELEKTTSVDITIKLYESFLLTDLAIEKNVSRIEVITRRISAQRFKD